MAKFLSLLARRVAVPRCWHRVNQENIELHLFSDASNDAFASIAYLVCPGGPAQPSNYPTCDACGQEQDRPSPLSLGKALELFSFLQGGIRQGNQGDRR